MSNPSFSYCILVPEIISDAFDKIVEERLLSEILAKLNAISMGDSPVKVNEYEMAYSLHRCVSGKAKLLINFDASDGTKTVVNVTILDHENSNLLAFGSLRVLRFIPPVTK